MVVAELSIIGLFLFFPTSAESTLDRRVNPQFHIGLRVPSETSGATPGPPLTGIAVVCVRFHEMLEHILHNHKH